MRRKICIYCKISAIRRFALVKQLQLVSKSKVLYVASTYKISSNTSNLKLIFFDILPNQDLDRFSIFWVPLQLPGFQCNKFPLAHINMIFISHINISFRNFKSKNQNVAQIFCQAKNERGRQRGRVVGEGERPTAFGRSQ